MTLTVRIAGKTQEARDVCTLELVQADGAPLPAFTAGAHIDLHLPGGLTRQYSLSNAPGETHRYRIAVLQTSDSRGGSRHVHAHLNAGDIVTISEPRNLFALNDSTAPVLLFAGGIGITPLLAMAWQLWAVHRPFHLHYSVRSADRAAFLSELHSSPFAACVTIWFDASNTLDIDAALHHAGPDTHLFVCGPAGYIDLVLTAARRQGWAEARLHREYFSAPVAAPATDDAFTLEIASTGAILHVPANLSALDVLITNGFDIPTSCEQGICGTCLTGVLGGEPDHRDLFLTAEEHAHNDQFTPCCSRARSATLRLDL